MSRVITGTSAIDAGDTMVAAWAGQTLTEINCPAGSPVVIEGMANFVKTRISSMSFEVELPHQGAGGAGLSTAISAMTPTEVSVGTLNSRTATVIQQLNVLDANGRGLFYNLIGVTGANDPGPGNMAFDNADPELITELYFDVLDANDGGRDVAGLIGLWKAGTVLIVRSLASSAFVAFQMTAAPVVAGGWRRVQVEPILPISSTLANEPMAVEWKLKGEQGESFTADDEVATMPERAAFDGVAPGFVIKVNDVGNGRAAFFTMGTGGAGAWGTAAYLTGAQGDPSTVPGPTGPPGTVWRGPYAAGTTYAINDGVSFNGSSFRKRTIAAAGTTPSAAKPPVHTADWEVASASGADGTGTGDMVGPAGAIDGRLALYDGPTGKLLKAGGPPVTTGKAIAMAIVFGG